jgi:adenosylhomocysteine nucleosidase
VTPPRSSGPAVCDTQPLVVILTALDLEYRAVRARLDGLRSRRHGAGTMFEVGRLPGGQGEAVVGVTGAGNSRAGILAERAIAMFAPRALLFVGVAGGLHDDVALGDLVVATKVYAYQDGKDGGDGFLTRPRAWEAPHALEQLARHVALDNAWTKLLDPSVHRGAVTVHFRPVAAGDVVLNARHTALADLLRRGFNDAAAVEMESAGVSQAAHLNRSVPVLTVRGISDRADGTKDAGADARWQPVAVGRAAAFAVALAAEILSRP